MDCKFLVSNNVVLDIIIFLFCFCFYLIIKFENDSYSNGNFILVGMIFYLFSLRFLSL